MSDQFVPPDFAMQILAIAPVFTLVEGWQTVTQPPTPGFLRAEALIQAAENIAGDARLAPLRSAVVAKDPRALAALEIFSAELKPVAAATRDSCLNLLKAGRFQDLLAEAERFRLLAAATGQDEFFLDALWLLANAFRGLNDADGAIASYRQVLATAKPDDRKRRSAALDNIANILKDAGDYDKALASYNESEKAAASLIERFSIVLNRAGLRMQLGEVSKARADFQAASDFLAEAAGAPSEWGVLYDFEAELCQSEGHLADALACAERAQGAFKHGSQRDQAINAMNRASLHKRLDQRTKAAVAFDEALSLAERAEASSVSEDAYRAGFAAALERRLPFTDTLYQLMAAALTLESQGKPQQAQQLIDAALKRAEEQGDILAFLRLQMNRAAQLQRAGQIPKATALADAVRRQAREKGLAYPEAGVIVTLSSMSDDGSDRAMDSLFGYVRAKLLFAMHRRILREFELDPQTLAFETADNGALDNQFSKMAERVGAYERAAEFARAAADKATEVAPFEWITANRLAGLLDLNRKLKRTVEADATAERLRSLLGDKRLTLRGRVIAGRALGNDTFKEAADQAKVFFKIAIDASEAIRGSITNLSERALVDRPYREIYSKYAMLLRQAGDTVAAYEALQYGRGRIFKDAHSDDGKPAALVQIQQALPPGETLVEFAVEEHGLAAYIVTASSLDVVTEQGNLDALQAADLGDMRQRAAKLLEICRRSPLLLKLIAKVAKQIGAGRRVLLVTAMGLHNLPLHATPVNGKAWCKDTSIGYLPGAAFLLAPTGAEAGSVFVAGNSRGDLPGADAECGEVAVLYGVRALKHPECTRSALKDNLGEGPLDIVHLAVHGRGNPRRGSQSSLMFATPGGGTELVDFETLAAQPWPARLVVLSGCSTGLGGLRDGRELVSVAGQILQAGAKTVVASLWSVGDENTRRVMRAFHIALKRGPSGWQDVRLALDAGRAELATGESAPTDTLRDGRDVLPEDSEPGANDMSASIDLDWASFVVVGNPFA